MILFHTNIARYQTCHLHGTFACRSKSNFGRLDLPKTDNMPTEERLDGRTEERLVSGPLGQLQYGTLASMDSLLNSLELNGRVVFFENVALTG